jgi:hypothetical protein
VGESRKAAVLKDLLHRLCNNKLSPDDVVRS